MALCVICLDTLKSPISLPCGHVYCHECILSKIEFDITHSSTHRCPSCRNPYGITNIDPNAVPGHLKNSMLPALRRIYLDEIQHSSPPPVVMDAEASKLRAENAILRAYCKSWKRRANLHSAVIYGVVQVAREQILSVRVERDQLEQKYQTLKRKHAELEASASSSSTSMGDTFVGPSGDSSSRPGSSESAPDDWKLSPALPPKKKLRGSTTALTVKLEPVT